MALIDSLVLKLRDWRGQPRFAISIAVERKNIQVPVVWGAYDAKGTKKCNNMMVS